MAPIGGPLGGLKGHFIIIVEPQESLIDIIVISCELFITTYVLLYLATHTKYKIVYKLLT